ncbi:acetyltransferase [Oxalobacteraceae bacterium CAVE-383]|nr:acetyltransferase [Oxalobacteraceae bacterium CAVE-383]
MRTEFLYLLGAGGHSKVVLDALTEARFDMAYVRIRDDNPKCSGESIIGFEISVPAVTEELAGACFHLAIGNCSVRRAMFTQLVSMGARALTIVHPVASVSRHAEIGDGGFIAARAIVAPSARLGKTVIVNHGAIIDHDCIVGDFSHIAPNATLGGNVCIGSGVLIGAGANILPGVHIGSNAIIGAGAVVIADVQAEEIQAGVPAKNLKRK